MKNFKRVPSAIKSKQIMTVEITNYKYLVLFQFSIINAQQTKLELSIKLYKKKNFHLLFIKYIY